MLTFVGELVKSDNEEDKNMGTIIPRVGKRGKTSYRAQIRMKGYPPVGQTFKLKTEAQNWIRDTETALRQNKYTGFINARSKTLADLINKYLQKIETDNPKRYHDLLPMLNWWKEEIGYLYLKDVNSPIIAEAIAKLSRKKKTRHVDPKKVASATAVISPARVNRYVTALSHVFTIGKKEWKWVEENPISDISKKREPRGRVRYLSEDERGRLLEACKLSNYQPLYLIVVLAISTGARKGEITSLKWHQVDFERFRIILETTKNGKFRMLPLHGLAYELLKAHFDDRMLGCEFVFPNASLDGPYDPRPHFEKAIKRAGISDFRFHDLRHTTASYLAMDKASLMEISEILGHETLQMVKRYAHLSDAHTHGVVGRMNERIFKSAKDVG